MNAENLRNIRISSGLSQKETAKKLNISQQRYNNYETGKREPDNDTLRQLVELFKCSADYLIGTSDNPKLSKKLYIPKELRGTGIAFDKSEGDLTQDEIDKIAEFVKFVKSQREN